jgi:hypothetical protein
VLTYVLNVATEPGFVIDDSVLRSMHFMLLDHDLSKAPGRYRTKEVFVRDDSRGVNVYEGPDSESVPHLVRALAESLSTPQPADPLVRGAMARPSYVKLTGRDERPATRDLVNAASLGLLEARGERRGRHYVAGHPLREAQARLRAERKPLEDPYPTLTAEIRRALPKSARQPADERVQSVSNEP